MERNWLIAIAALFIIFLALIALRVFEYGPVMPYGPGYSNAPMGPGMMYGPGYSTVGCPGMAIYHPKNLPVGQSDALRSIENFASRYGANVKVEDFMAFSNNYYAELADAGNGRGLAEVLVDRYSGDTYLEPGPSTIWNVRYGGGGALGEESYDLATAQNVSGQFLQSYLPRARIMRSKAFPGYYTFDFGRSDVEGMLSVNSYTGDVWVHTWHGFYLGETGSNTTS